MQDVPAWQETWRKPLGLERGEVRGREEGLQQSHRACPRRTLAVLVWHDEVEGPQRLGRGESDFATVSRIN